MVPSSASPASSAVPSDVLRSLADEIRGEDERLLFPMMARVNEVADAIMRGESVDPDYLEEAIRLWSRFVNEVHQRRMERIQELYRVIVTGEAPATLAARRRRHFGRKPKAVAHLETTSDRYNEIRGTQTRMSERLAVLEGLAAAYRRHEYHSEQLLASLLRSGAFSDRAWAQYEEEFVRGHLAEKVSKDEEAVLRQEVKDSDTRTAPVERDVREFLERPIRFKPPAP
jgi:hypothetical protein